MTAAAGLGETEGVLRVGVAGLDERVRVGDAFRVNVPRIVILLESVTRLVGVRLLVNVLGGFVGMASTKQTKHVENARKRIMLRIEGI